MFTFNHFVVILWGSELGRCHDKVSLPYMQVRDAQSFFKSSLETFNQAIKV
jgi:hypothetical protein